MYNKKKRQRLLLMMANFMCILWFFLRFSAWEGVMGLLMAVGPHTTTIKCVWVGGRLVVMWGRWDREGLWWWWCVRGGGVGKMGKNKLLTCYYYCCYSNSSPLGGRVWGGEEQVGGVK